mmetsp:Transcript_12607/g.18859  ORF Transcript_12607/g.18859 Transcript_12607/m.18859 type:complete len:418 (-) Transcript_12607:132-1385(-)
MQHLNVQAYALAAKDTSGVMFCQPIERRAPNKNDVLIDVKYCGICHSDLSEVRGEWPKPHIYPMVPGHEIVGVVKEVGSSVTKFKAGDRVGVGCMVDSCSDCRSCKRGLEQYCTGGGAVFTYNSLITDKKKINIKNHPHGEVTLGGYSTAITVKDNFVVHVPDSTPLEKAGPLLCAGITVYSPLVRYGAKKGGKGFKTGVVGFGGLGHMAVKIAKAMGNEVSVISRGTKKRKAALECGADSFIDSKSVDAMAKANGSFDLIINTVGVNHSLSPYMNLVGLDGTLCMVGVPPDSLSLHAFEVIGARKSFSGSLIGGIKETEEMLSFCAEHKIVPDIELINAQDVNKALTSLAKGHNDASRYVIDMKTLNKATTVAQVDVDPTEWRVNLPHLTFPKSALHQSHRSEDEVKVEEKLKIAA